MYLLVLGACSGSGRSPENEIVYFSVGGHVIKGPLSNSLVGLDYNGDGIVDSSTVRSGSDGSYSLTASNNIYTVVAVTDDTTVDMSSGTVLSGVTFKAPSGASVVTPTTTLMEEGNLTSAQVVKVLGLPDGVDPLNFDPYASDADPTAALAVEKVSHQIMSVVTAFASSVEGAGAGEEEAFKAALTSVVAVVKAKAANLTDEAATNADQSLDLTNFTDLALIKTQVQAEVDTVAGVNTTAFNALIDETTVAIENINTKISAATDLTSDTSKNIFSTTQVLSDQVKKAVAAEVNNANSGNISFTSMTIVDEAATNAAPIDITLDNNEISESATSLIIGVVTTTDSDQTAGENFVYNTAGADQTAFSIDNSTGELSLIATPDFETKSSYNLNILSTDEDGKTLSKSFTVNVKDENDTPTVSNAISDQTISEDSALSFQLPPNIFSDEDKDDILTYTNTLLAGNTLPAWLSFDSTTRTFSGTPENGDVGVVDIQITATDTGLASASTNFSIIVLNSNDAPSDITLSSSNINENTDIILSGLSAYYPIGNLIGTDVDPSDTLTYSILESFSSDHAAFVIDKTSKTLGLVSQPDFEIKSSYTVMLKAIDNAGESISKTFQIKVLDYNEAPVITSGSLTEIVEDEYFYYVFSATDPDEKDTVTYSSVFNPSWLSFDTTTGLLSGTPTVSNIGDHLVRLKATDSHGLSSSRFFTITVTDGFNDTPTITSTAVTYVDEDVVYSYTFSARDLDIGDSITYAASTKPNWLSFSPSTGVLSGTPTNNDVGKHKVILTATDTADATVQQKFIIEVLNVNDAPTITSTAVTYVDEDVVYSYTFSARDLDIGDSITYAASTKPNWLSFSPSTGVLSGTPTNNDVGKHKVILTATDTANAFVQQEFIIEVINVNDAPSIEAINEILSEDSGASIVSGFLYGTDVDNGTTLTFSSNSLQGTYGTLSLDKSTGFYTYSLDNSNTAIQKLKYSETLIDNFVVSVSDGSIITSTTLNFHIYGVNDAPTGLSLSGNAIYENSFGAVVGKLSAFDIEDDLVIYSLGAGSDNELFEILGTTLKMKDLESANYEEDNVYDLDIIASDGIATTSLAVQILVLNTNEANSSSYLSKKDANLSANLNPQNDPAFENLMSGYFWGEPGYGIDLNYSFSDSSSNFSDAYDRQALAQKNFSQNPSDIFKTTVKEVLELFSNISLLNFFEIQETNNVVGHLRFGTTSVENSAFAWLPYEGFSAAGDSWYNSTNNWFNDPYALMDGTYWNQTIIHEVGHALGLAHSQESSQISYRTYGIDAPDGSEHNALPYTNMAYPEYVGDPPDGLENYLSRPTNLMIDDVAAIQHLYGVNEQYNISDNIYQIDTFDMGSYNALYGDQYIYASIWDAGGIDTISWSTQNSSANIDLNDGAFSSFGNITGPNDTDLDKPYMQDGDGLLGIGYNVIIENAIGGTGSDTIVGNQIENILYGGAGSNVKDILSGGAGADIFVACLSDASSDLSSADVIKDFSDGIDLIGLEDRSVSDLRWSNTASGTKIFDNATSKVLFLLDGIDASEIDHSDFIITDFV